MFDRNLMKLPGMRAVMGALAVLALLQAGCTAGWAAGLSGAVCALWEGRGIEAASPGLALFAACFAVLQLARFAQETMLDRHSLERARDLRDSLLARTFDASSRLSLRVGAARVAALANDGIDEVQAYVRIIPPKAVGIAAVSLPLLVLEFATDWPSGVILAVMFPVIVFFMVLLGRQARERSERQYAAYTRLTNRFMDTLRGLPVLKVFGAARAEGERVRENSEKVRAATVRTLRTATLSSAVLDLCATFGVAAVAIMLAFRLMDGSISLYIGLLALIVAPECLAPVRSFASDYHASLDGKNALAAVLELLDAARYGDSALPDDLVGTRSSASVFPGRADALERVPTEAGIKAHVPSSSESPSISFKDVGYRYESGAAGVEGVSFEASGCEKIAVIGASGSGKSTLANLFAGFAAPTSGSVEASPGWRESVRYIPQSPYIFRATLDENIRFYRPDATRAEVGEAVRAAGLDALVAELPDGLDTLVGDGARGLSGGEAHRVALARVLCDRAARVLVFDEPTAHLDVETERDLKAPMLAAMEGKLVLFATHRLHWAADMDRVIELEEGRMSRDTTLRESQADSAASAAPVGTPSRASAQPGQADALERVPTGVSQLERFIHVPSASGPAGKAGASERVPAGGNLAGRPARRFPAWFKDYLVRYKRAIASALALGLLASACAALLMFASGYLISKTAVAATTLFSVMVPVACVQLFGLGRPLARYAERLASHDWVLRVTSDLRLALYRAVEERTGDPARERAAGEYLGLLSDDVAHLQNLYLRVVFPVAVAYLLALGAAALFGLFSVPFALVMLLAFAGIVGLLPLGCLLATRAAAMRAKALRAGEYAALADDVRGAVDWVLSGRGVEAHDRHATADAEIREAEARERLVRRAFSLASTLLLVAVMCGVVAWAGAAFGGGAGDANWIAAFALGSFPLVESFSALPAALSEATEHREAVARLDEYVGGEGDSTSPVAELPDETGGEPAGGPAIRLAQASYAYPGSPAPALDDVSLSIAPGERVAVLGRSGAGKTTLARLACGTLKPDAGNVEARGRVGYVGQVPYLFNRTLRENLTLGVAQADDGRLESVLRAVGLGPKLDALERGLDTVVGETGAGFSGGEAHRVAIARVLVADYPIVVVDEPFAALDPETERALLDTLLDACAGRTLVVITHHLAQIERFDRVVFVEGGRIDLDGAPARLLEESPRFRDLVAFDE